MNRQRSSSYQSQFHPLPILKFILRTATLICVLFAIAFGETTEVSQTDDILVTIDNDITHPSTTEKSNLPSTTPRPTRPPPPKACEVSGHGKVTYLTYEEREIYYRSLVKSRTVLDSFALNKYGLKSAAANRKYADGFRAKLSEHWIIDYPVLDQLRKVAKFVVAMWVPFILGIVGNYMVLYTVLVYLKSRSATNILLCSLAITDFLTLLIVVPLKTFSKIKSESIVIGMGCGAIAFIEHVFFHASILLLVTMAVERYITICHPLRAKIISTSKNIKKSIIVSYVLSIIFSVPTFLTYGELHLANKNRPECIPAVTCTDYYYVQGEGDLMQQVRTYPYVVVECLVYFGAIVLLILCYGMVGRSLHASIKESQAMKAGTKELPLGAKKVEDHDANSRMRIVKMLVVVVIFFVVCWGPIVLLLVLNVLRESRYTKFRDQNTTDNWTLRNSCWTLAMANSCVNPFIYLAMSRSFRRGFKASLGCGSKDDTGTGINRSKNMTRHSQYHSDTNSVSTRTESVAG